MFLYDLCKCWDGYLFWVVVWVDFNEPPSPEDSISKYQSKRSKQNVIKNIKDVTVYRLRGRPFKGHLSVTGCIQLVFLVCVPGAAAELCGLEKLLPTPEIPTVWATRSGKDTSPGISHEYIKVR